MTEISYQPYTTYEPKLGKSIKRVEIAQDNIFITDEHNNIFQVWLNFDDLVNVPEG